MKLILERIPALKVDPVDPRFSVRVSRFRDGPKGPHVDDIYQRTSRQRDPPHDKAGSEMFALQQMSSRGKSTIIREILNQYVVEERREDRQCSHCGRVWPPIRAVVVTMNSLDSLANGPLRQCSGCVVKHGSERTTVVQKTMYCDRECQKKDWRAQHKKTCLKLHLSRNISGVH